MKSVLLALFLILPTGIFSQEQPQSPPPPPEYGWKHNVVAGLTLSQISFKDWSQGGENALAFTAMINGKSVQDMEHTNWVTNFNFAFGEARIGGQSLRKTDDIIDLSTILVYKAGIAVDPFVSASLKTQFAPGYIYQTDGTEAEVSNFFDPAYLTQMIGLAYQPAKEVKTRLGFGLREIITSNHRKYADPKEIDKTSIDGGIESVTNVDWPLDENLLLTSQLEFFVPVKTPGQITTRNTTAITAKVNKYVTALFMVQLLNEPKTFPRVQIKETIALGLSYTIF
jgi:hypothetical protein